MSAVRKLEYITPKETAIQEQHIAQPQRIKIAQPKYVILATAIMSIAVIVAVSYFFYALLQRHAEIDRLQIEIFNLQQSIKRTEVMVDELYVIRESYMTIEEIETYATENLKMVKPTDQQKVVLVSENYIPLDPSIAFKQMPDKAATANWVAEGLQMLSASIDQIED